jgi:hypothetical protein
MRKNSRYLNQKDLSCLMALVHMAQMQLGWQLIAQKSALVAKRQRRLFDCATKSLV